MACTDTQTPTTGTVTISAAAFGRLLEDRARYLLSVANHLPKHQLANGILTRPLLGRLMLQSIEIQELLDAYGAKNSRSWCRFRHLVATVRLFASVGYELLHIQHTLPHYHLVDIGDELPEATRESLALVSFVLLRVCTELIAEAEAHGLEVPPDTTSPGTYDESLPAGRLAHDLTTREVENVYETVTLLATAFLNLAQEARVLSRVEATAEDLEAYVGAGRLGKESLHRLCEQYRNLQSLYDTYVSDTRAESLDRDLGVLRGHISLSKHLLSVAATLAEYYEQQRRVARRGAATALRIVEPEEVLHVMVDYGVAHAVHYTTAARTLCQSMLKRYTEIDSVDVSVPVYRGFHVRPSTLVAAIANHYGTEVTMELDGERVNAAIPLEIFRINEKINAAKRRLLTQRVAALDLAEHDRSLDLRAQIYRSILQLAQHGLLVIYEQPLTLTDQAGGDEGLFLRCLSDEIRRLLAEGKLDICADMTVRFEGDRRVLDDLKILAANGYGEDRFGNNIPLPERLRYLRR